MLTLSAVYLTLKLFIAVRVIKGRGRAKRYQGHEGTPEIKCLATPPSTNQSECVRVGETVSQFSKAFYAKKLENANVFSAET